MKKKLLLFPLIAGLLYIILSSYSSAPGGAHSVSGSGAQGGTGCGSSGSGCHGGGASTSTVVNMTLDSAGTNVTHYIAGHTYNVKISGVNTLSSSSLTMFGFQLTVVKLAGAGLGSAANAGVLATSGIPTNTATHNITSSSFIITEHTARLSPTSGTGGPGTTYVVSIPWTAPVSGTGTVVLYGVINAINNSGGADAGDKWNNDSTQISELILPVAPITGAHTVCVGANITLSDSTGGGAWGSLNPSIASVSTGGVVHGVAAGTAVITYAAGTAGTAYDTIIVVGPPSAGTLSGATQICHSTSVTLTSTVSGGTWTSSAPSIVSINSGTGVAYGVAVGTATLTYTVTGTCGSGTSIYRDTVVNTVTAGSIAGPATVCPGGTATMTRTSGGGGGTWSSTNTAIATINSSTGIVTGLTTGTVTISYFIASSCGSVSATTTITVISAPPAIMGPSSTCVNSPITLTDSIPSGLWSSSNSSIAVAAAGLGTITGVSAGTATITYTAPSGCFITRSILVNRIPAPITGTFSVCPGNTTTVTDTSIGGVWSSSDTNKAKFIAPGSLKGVNAGIATISYTYPATGCYVTMPVTINPMPPFIAGSQAICATKTDSLVNYTAGGAWSATPSSVATISATGMLYGVSGGTASVTYTLPTGCSVTRNIVVHPLPVPVIYINYATSTLFTSTYYVSYAWYENGTLVPGATINTFSFALAGTYYVYVKDTFGCENRSTDFVITNLGIHTTGITADQIKISPNPASDYINIETSQPLRAVITGLEGRVMLEQVTAKTIDISTLPSGMYMLLLFDEAGNRVAVNKLIKE